MQKVLSLLLAFVVLQTQAWALSGGPVFGSGARVANYIGTYGGVLVPQQVETGLADNGQDSGGPTASIGLFSISQPEVGVATGSILVFLDGAAFNGTVTGIIDPDNGTFAGVIDARSTFDVILFIPERTQNEDGSVSVTFTREEFPVFAQGTIEAQVIFTGLGAPVNAFGIQIGPTQPARIEGVSSIDVFFEVQNDGTPLVNKTARYDLDGFKQSDTANAASDFDFGSDFDFSNN
jgi:hypothetical protein